MKPLKIVLAERVLGLLEDTSLPDIAYCALLEGWSSPSLGALAGMNDNEFNAFIALDLYQRALKELELAEPSLEKAVYMALSYYVKSVAAGNLSAIEGVTSIQKMYDRVRDRYPSIEMVGDALGIDVFIGLYYEITDIGACQRQYAKPSVPREELLAYYENKIKHVARRFDLEQLKRRILK